jgi:hypothetical protein
VRVDQIKPGGVYAQCSEALYFRQVEMIVAAPARPGGFVVQWSTDAFNVLGAKHRMHGKCGIETFARWARIQINENQHA